MQRKSINYVYSKVGQRIINARSEKGISQEKLATDSGVDRSHVGFIEQGRRRPTLATLFKLTRALDISLEQLFKDL